jgi:hypothetical protein
MVVHPLEEWTGKPVNISDLVSLVLRTHAVIQRKTRCANSDIVLRTHSGTHLGIHKAIPRGYSSSR